MNDLTIIVPTLVGSKSKRNAMASEIKFKFESARRVWRDVHVRIAYDLKKRGFTWNVNRIMKLAIGRGSDFLLLNDDAELLDADWGKMRVFLKEHPNAGVIGFKIFTDKTKQHIYHAGGLQMYPYGVHKGGDKDVFTKPTLERWVNFSAVLIRADLVIDIGLLDKNLKMFFSDSDYCVMAQERGWEVWFVPYLEFSHEIGVSGHLENEMLDRFLIDRYYFERKYFGMNNPVYQTGVYYDITHELIEE